MAAREQRGRRTALPSAPSEGTTTAVLATLLACTAVVPLIPLLVRVDPNHVAPTVAHAALCGVGAGIAVFPRFRPMLLIASVFPYCWLVLPSIYQIATTQAAWGDAGVTTQFSATLRAQLVLALAQGCLLVGYLAYGRRAPRPELAWRIAPGRRRRMTLLAGVYLVGALALTPLLVSAAGGPGALFSSRNTVGENAASAGLGTDTQVLGSLVRVAPSGFAIAASVLALWLIRATVKGTRERALAVGLSGVAFLLLLIVANPFTTPRYFVLAAFGTFIIALLRPRGSLVAFGWLVMGVVALLLAYPAANYFRYGEALSGPEQMLASPDFDGFQQMVNTVTLVDAQGWDFGLHLLSAIFFFVPRAFWAAKAEPSTFEIAGARGYDFLDLSTPFPAETYLAFGWGGVIVIMLGVGALWAFLDRHWLDQSRIAVIAGYLAVAQVGMWRGPFGSLSGVFGFTVGLLVVAVFLTTGNPDLDEPGDPNDATGPDAVLPGEVRGGQRRRRRGALAGAGTTARRTSRAARAPLS